MKHQLLNYLVGTVCVLRLLVLLLLLRLRRLLVRGGVVVELSCRGTLVWDASLRPCWTSWASAHCVVRHIFDGLHGSVLSDGEGELGEVGKLQQV